MSRYFGLASFIGLRYARAKTENRFIRFISASSISGIAIGCMALILVLSAMNGFEKELKERLLNVVSHIEYRAVEKQGLSNWQQAIDKLNAMDHVVATAPFVHINGLVQHQDKLKPIALTGIDWRYENAVSDLASYIPAQQVDDFKSNGGLILGQAIVNDLGLKVGDDVEILIPQISDELKFTAPQLLSLPLAGVFNMGGQLDSLVGYMPLALAKETAGWHEGVQGLRLKVDDVDLAPQLARSIGYQLPYYVYMSNWTHEYGHLYSDIELVRTISYIILALVIAVACFNIVSTLVMAVNEKQGDIAILKTMGASRSSIIKTFVIQGLYNGLLGTSIGVFLGVLLAKNLSTGLAFIEQALSISIMPKDIYFVDFIPSLLIWQDVAIIAFVAIAMALLASVYPALKATKVDPAQVLGR